jgi:hypothetical protein
MLVATGGGVPSAPSAATRRPGLWGGDQLKYKAANTAVVK